MAGRVSCSIVLLVADTLIALQRDYYLYLKKVDGKIPEKLACPQCKKHTLQGAGWPQALHNCMSVEGRIGIIHSRFQCLDCEAGGKRGGENECTWDLGIYLQTATGN